VLALGIAAGAPAASASSRSGSSAAAAPGQAGSSHGTACIKTASGRLADCPSPLARSELPAGARNPAIVTSPVAQSDLAALVDTRTWTSGGGNTFPGADVPFGMVQWSPDTSPNRSVGGGYNYGDTSLTGYSLTHVSGPGCGAGGDVPILPLTGALPSGNPNSVLSSFTNTGEIAQAGYYSAQSNMPNTITSQFTATPRTSMGRFTFPSTTQADFLIKLQDSQNGDFGDSAQIVGNNEVTGTDTSGNFCGETNNDGQLQQYTVHFDLVFSQPFTASQVITESGQADPAAVFLTFNTTTDPVISAKVAISYVSTANAQLNLRTGNPGWNFEAVKAAAQASWDHLLGRIGVSGGSYAQTQEFYSLLYKDFLQPNITSDVNGQYMGADMQVHTISAPQRNQYGIYSGWDIYHSLSQLQAMLDPQAASDQAQSLVNYYGQDKILQQWGYLNLNNYVMVGDPAQSIIADYYAFGARDFNTKQALADMLKQATTVNDVRPGEALEAKYGYLPEDGSYGCCNAHGYVPTMLEYDSADLALSQFAASQGDHKDAAMLQQRANNWENVFDPGDGLLNPRDEDGQFVPDITPTATGAYVEGSAYEYLWDVPNDYSALFTLLGGDSKVVPALTQYWSHPNGYGMYGEISNEFDLGEQYALDYAGDPAGTQHAVNAIENTVYLPGPTGLANNDDLGAESSQFIWEMLGLYPENSGSGNLVFNSPGFPHAAISLPDGRTITINAPGASPTEFYADSLRINGQPYSKLYVPYSALSHGATLNWTLGTTPTAWGSAPQDAPPSYTSGLKPVVGALSSEQLTVAPGSSTTVQVTADNVTSEPQAAQVSLSAPAGLTVSPSSGTISVPPDGTGTLTLTVSAPASASRSYYQVYSLPVTMTAGSGSRVYSDSFGVTVLVGQQSSLKAVGYADNYSTASVSPLYQAVLQDGTTTLVPATPIPVQANPDGIAMSPDGSTVYVTCQGADANSVVPINTATNTAGTPIPVGQVPLGIAVSPNGKDAYVADYGSDNVDVIDLSSGTVVATIPVGSEPYGVAVTPDGSTVYVSNYGDDTVTPIDTATLAAGTPIPVGSEPRSIAVSGTTAYVADQGSNTLTPINTATNAAGSPIALPGSGPYADAIDTANLTLYVTDVNSASVVPVSLSTNQPGTQIPVSSGPQGIAVSGTGNTVYVSSTGQSSITPIEASTGTPEDPVSVSSPFGIVFLPSSS
jgi:predicted alpha-1,2-mannosidase